LEKTEFVQFRKKLSKTQKEMAQLLGVSIKAVHSYEQGWRSIPAHVERQILFLLYQTLGDKKSIKQCWKVLDCPKERKRQCPAWEFKSGKLCWFINGTICSGVAHEKWKDKIKICRKCEVMAPILKP